MRVSEQMIFNNLTNRLRRQSSAILMLQEQVSTGKRINRPSDDPIGQAEIINFDKSLLASDQYLRNIDRLESFVVASEIVIQAVQNQLHRARELAVQGANATNTAVDRTIMAKEVRQIYDQLIALANTSHEGAYIFAGNETNTQPFVNKGTFIGTTIPTPATITAASNDVLNMTVDGVTASVTISPITSATGAQLATQVQTAINATTSFQSAGISVAVTFDTDHLVFTSNGIGGTSAATPNSGTAFATLVGAGPGTNRPAGTYLGDSGEIGILIGENTTVTKNLPGDRLFRAEINGTSVGTSLLSTIAALQTALETNSVSGIQTALGDLDGAFDGVNNERALSGARLNRADTSASVLRDFKLTVTQLKSAREDVDLSSAISALLLQQTALEATLLTSARIVRQTLLDFLR